MTKQDLKNKVVNDLMPLFPEKIIIFGSLAKGKFIEGKSDIDLLLIKQTSKKMVDRYGEARLALTPNYPFDIFVLTKKELEKKMIESFFFREIVNEGEIIYERH